MFAFSMFSQGDGAGRRRRLPNQRRTTHIVSRNPGSIKTNDSLCTPCAICFIPQSPGDARWPLCGLAGAFFDGIIDSLLENYSITFSDVGKRYNSGLEGTQNSNLPNILVYKVNSTKQNEIFSQNFAYEVKKTERSIRPVAKRPV